MSPQQRRSVTDLMPMIGARFYTQLDNVQSRTDVLENEVSKEMENGRLFRLLVKLGSINERPEYCFLNECCSLIKSEGILGLISMELGRRLAIDIC